MPPDLGRIGPRDNIESTPPMTIDAPETEIVDQMRIACDGGEGALGHPRVWLSIPPDRGWVECGYCDKKFIHRDFADRAE